MIMMNPQEVDTMKKTLVFTASKPFNRTLVYDISSKAARDAAYIDLFNILDVELDVYRQKDEIICALIDLARAGNAGACEALLCYRRNRQGEQFEEIDIRPVGPNSRVLTDDTPRPGVTVFVQEAVSDQLLPNIDETETPQ